ncbi:MAG: dihydroorotase [Chitinophagales bacterium]|nr:dihydroorotase [Chitinophagales bacterium]
MKRYLIKNGQVVNEGKIIQQDILIEDQIISKIDSDISHDTATIIDAQNQYVIPGIIDDQVHFREPGLTHKAHIYNEAKAAVAGGTTSFMEMPNTKPPALTQQLLEDKYQIGKNTSLANYSFFMGVSNDNYDEVMRTSTKEVCGIKIFMGSSTGNMLVDNEHTLSKIFANTPMLIATHCENENRVKERNAYYQQKLGDSATAAIHPIIRDDEACYLSSSFAVDLAKKHQTRLHILHISTEKELALFDNALSLSDKKITSEVCVHHLYFNANDYAQYGNLIKCNPAIKSKENQDALLKALLDNRLDIIATDHAPHTWEEKQQYYWQAPSGVPLVQHSLNIMLDFYHRGLISLEKIVEKMSHAPAQCFKINNRGYLRAGYFADIAIVDINQLWQVNKDNILYQCAWSPFENQTIKGKVNYTFVSGHLAYNNGIFDESQKGLQLSFNR